ncbi:MAG: NAD-dependent protein deacylase [Pseudomonadota bacterium]|nr:NAD-dependent protein deacylase [Rubrivivax sp.]NLZ41956.1 NAD-dependent protein deacylase [Comamonadaceae bacterium]
MEPGDDFVAARRVLQAARSLVALTGAGISAESGIPTFRDAQTGLWSQFDAMALASEPGFRARPERAWDWYAERRAGVQRTEPNAAHRALAAFEQRHPGRLRIVTQNVDDLHQRAGSRDVLRLHGDILRVRWLDPCPLQPACDTDAAAAGRPPRCARCGNLLRPDVVWFGEVLPAAALAAAEAAVARCDALLVVGTSGSVWPAAGLAGLARRAGAQVLIVNRAASEIDSEATQILRGAAAALLPALLAPI